MIRRLINRYRQHNQDKLINRVAMNYFRYIDEDFHGLCPTRNSCWYRYGGWLSDRMLVGYLTNDSPSLLLLEMTETFLDLRQGVIDSTLGFSGMTVGVDGTLYMSGNLTLPAPTHSIRGTLTITNCVSHSKPP